MANKEMTIEGVAAYEQRVAEILSPAIDTQTPYAKTMIRQLVELKLIADMHLITKVAAIVRERTSITETVVSGQPYQAVPVIWDVDGLLEDIKQAIARGP